MSLVGQKANWILIVNDGFALHLVDGGGLLLKKLSR